MPEVIIQDATGDIPVTDWLEPETATEALTEIPATEMPVVDGEYLGIQLGLLGGVMAVGFVIATGLMLLGFGIKSLMGLRHKN